MSGDGATWDAVPLEGRIDLVSATPDGFIAFGRQLDERRPLVATSRDGMSWSEQRHDLFAIEGVSMASLVPFDGGLVVAGIDWMRRGATVWVSDDGSRWIRTPFESDPGTSIDKLLVAGDRLFAVGADEGRQRTRRPAAIAMWESPDAVAWERVGSSDLFATATASSVASVGRSIMIWGTLVPGHGSAWPEPESVVWVRDASPARKNEEPALISR